MKKSGSVLVLLLVVSGCYHAQIVTGLQPSAQTIQRPWAHGWLWGLVPPSTIETMQTCTSGVARVETKHSFVNQLAGFLTSGIYTPISITVTCAMGDDQDADMTRALPIIRDRTDAQRAVQDSGTFLLDLR